MCFSLMSGQDKWIYQSPNIYAPLVLSKDTFDFGPDIGDIGWALDFSTFQLHPVKYFAPKTLMQLWRSHDIALSMAHIFNIPVV